MGATEAETNALPVRLLLVAPAQRPTVIAPPDGVRVRASEPPTLRWAPNHNSTFLLRFSNSPHLGRVRVDAGNGFTITTTEWQNPGVWSRVIGLSRSSRGGTVYFSVFARDALGRKTWSNVRSLQIVDDVGGALRSENRRPVEKLIPPK
jgi:hypothetical protein